MCKYDVVIQELLHNNASVHHSAHGTLQCAISPTEEPGTIRTKRVEAEK